MDGKMSITGILILAVTIALAIILANWVSKSVFKTA